MDIELCCCAPARAGTLLSLSMAVNLRESCVLQDVALFSSSYNISVNFTAKCMHDGFLVLSSLSTCIILVTHVLF